MKNSALHIYIRLTGGLLLAMALTNLVRVAEGGAALRVWDPLLSIPMWLGLLVTGIMELAAALFCLLGRPAVLPAGLIVWLAINLVIYRSGQIWQGTHWQWGSVGNPLETLRLFPQVTDLAMYGIMIWLLAGGSVALVLLWEPATLRRQAELLKSLKIACPECQGHIEFPAHALGQKIACPHCKMAITLKEPA